MIALVAVEVAPSIAIRVRSIPPDTVIMDAHQNVVCNAWRHASNIAKRYAPRCMTASTRVPAGYGEVASSTLRRLSVQFTLPRARLAAPRTPSSPHPLHRSRSEGLPKEVRLWSAHTSLAFALLAF